MLRAAPEAVQSEERRHDISKIMQSGPGKVSHTDYSEDYIRLMQFL